MKSEIDQSGKVENTSKHTILCLGSEDYSYTILLPSNTKKELQNQFRMADQPKNFVLYTFSALLTILLEQSFTPQAVVVDREYWGQEHIIAKLVYEMLSTASTRLTFALVGKHSAAHYRAYEVSTGKLKADYIVSYKEVIEVLKKTEVGKRLANA